MKQLQLIVLAAVVLIVGSLAVVGAQEDSQAELTRLCAAFTERWEAAGGEASGLTIPDWCNTDAQASLPTTDSDNACDGGLLDGRCGSDWEWTCGYYLQQWENAGGWNGSYKFPDWCDPASILPPKPEAEEGTVVTPPPSIAQAGCFPFYKGYYLKTTGDVTQTRAPAYYDNACATTIAGYDDIVWASSQSEAEVLCAAISPRYPAYSTPTINLWRCS